MRKLNVTMAKLMAYMGLDLRQDIEDLRRLRKAKVTKHFAHEGRIVDEAEYDDNSTQLKALELSLKLKGALDNQSEDSGSVKALVQIIHNHNSSPQGQNGEEQTSSGNNGETRLKAVE